MFRIGERTRKVESGENEGVCFEVDSVRQTVKNFLKYDLRWDPFDLRQTTPKSMMTWNESRVRPWYLREVNVWLGNWRRCRVCKANVETERSGNRSISQDKDRSDSETLNSLQQMMLNQKGVTVKTNSWDRWHMRGAFRRRIGVGGSWDLGDWTLTRVNRVRSVCLDEYKRFIQYKSEWSHRSIYDKKRTLLRGWRVDRLRMRFWVYVIG